MILARHLDGQGVPLSAHFGSLHVPTADNIWEIGFSTDRFTEHTKPSDSASARDQNKFDTKLRHYALRSTLGINSYHISRSLYIRRWASVVRIGAVGGTIENEPSEFFQNEFRHKDAGLDKVPWGHVTTASHYGGLVTIDRFVDALPHNGHLNLATYGGLETFVSNIYDEVALRLGVRTTYIDLFGWRLPPQLEAGVRKGLFVKPNSIIMLAPWDTGAKSWRDVVANTYTSSTIAVRLPLHAWIRNRMLIPDLVTGLSSHSGFFMARPHTDSIGKTIPFKRIPEKFQTFAALWGNGDVGLETYNDSPGDKDIGPTYGVRAYIRWRYWGVR